MTGVQTCALPISLLTLRRHHEPPPFSPPSHIRTAPTPCPSHLSPDDARARIIPGLATFWLRASETGARAEQLGSGDTHPLAQVQGPYWVFPHTRHAADHEGYLQITDSQRERETERGGERERERERETQRHMTEERRGGEEGRGEGEREGLGGGEEDRKSTRLNSSH